MRADDGKRYTYAALGYRRLPRTPIRGPPVRQIRGKSQELNILEETQVVYADTSYFYAALDRRDRDHDRAQALARQVQEQGVGIVTTPPNAIIHTSTPLQSSASDTLSETPAIRAIRNRYGVPRIARSWILPVSLLLLDQISFQNEAFENRVAQTAP